MRLDLNALAAVTSDCPDCQTPPGTLHQAFCDVATCLDTGLQRLLHVLPMDDLQRAVAGIPADGRDGHECGDDMWTGERRGVAECRDADLFVRRDGDTWVPCPTDWPGATPDLTRLFSTATWSPAAHRWMVTR